MQRIYIHIMERRIKVEDSSRGEVDKKSPDYAKISKQRPLSEEFYR
jgi:hypothetical protein